jgi:hypothetical protein
MKMALRKLSLVIVAVQEGRQSHTKRAGEQSGGEMPIKAANFAVAGRSHR